MLFYLYSEALCVLLNVTTQKDITVYATAAEAGDLTEVLIDILQMFRDITPVFCLSSQLILRLIAVTPIAQVQVQLFIYMTLSYYNF